MNTAIQELIHFIENDRMQSSYTKEQVIELLTFKLEKEKEQMHKCASFWRGKENEIEKPIFDEYYNETFKSE